MSARRFLGVDLGATKLLAVLVDEGGAVLARLRRATGRGLGPSAAIEQIGAVAAEIRAEAGAFDALGVGFPGLVDSEAGMARSSVMLDGWERVPLAEQLAQAVGVPCAVDNDVNNAARAELRARAHDAQTSLLFVSVGTGIGGALAFDGAIWTGASGVAGEVGHVSIERGGPRCGCGARGCVNLYASGAAIERRLGIEAGSLARAAASGRSEVQDAIREAGAALGSAVASVLNVINVPLVVLGGGVAELGAPYLAAMERAAREHAFAEVVEACRFEIARAGYDAGAIGSAWLAQERAARPRAQRSSSGQPASRAIHRSSPR